jgi:hypothetical protein
MTVLVGLSGGCGAIAVAWVPLLVVLTALSGHDQPQEPGQGNAKDSPPAQSTSRSSTGSSATKADAPSPKKKAHQAPSAPIPPQKAKAGTDGDVRVRTQAEMRKPKSPFLLPPGAAPGDRYGSGPDDLADWNELPAWRKVSFFGMRARGQFFVYVVDCSESMIDDDRLPRATIELRRSVFALREPQKFEVIFYNSESIPMPGGPRPRTADQNAKNLLRSWLRLIEPIGGTDPRPALKQALALRPDAVFLLSDGAFPDGTVDEVAKLNTRKTPIHCVDVTGGVAGDQLERIAVASGGQYASKPGDLQARP